MRTLTLLLLAACTDSADVSTGDPAPCDDGYARDDAGNCVEIEAADTDTDTDTDTDLPVDADADGSPVEADCDDNDSRRYPGADEVCDGVDNDCDAGTADPTVGRYADSDGDGYGTGELVEVCEGVAGYALEAGDCDDADGARFPGAADDSEDGVDNDCDGNIDEDWDPCATAYGRADWWTTDTQYAYGYVGDHRMLLEGDAYVCEVTCDAWWLTPSGLTEAAGCSTYESEPYLMSGEVAVCISIADAGARAEGSCTAHTSAGDVTLAIVWSE